LNLPANTNAIVSIDASDLIRVSRHIGWVESQKNQVISAKLTRVANAIVNDLSHDAPVSGKPNKRHPLPLNKSYYFTRPGMYVRNVETSEPLKHAVVSRGAKPPTFGEGYIFPRQKKALWWPGLAHPIHHVSGHPGIEKNPFEENIMKKYTGSATGGILNTQWIGESTGDWWVETLTNLINTNKVDAALFTEILGRHGLL